MYITDFLKIFKSPVFRLGFGILGIVTVLSLANTLVSLWKRQDILKSRQVVKEARGKENEELKQKLEETKTDFFVEKEARDKLGYSKEGEVVIVVPRGTDVPGVQSSEFRVQSQTNITQTSGGLNQNPEVPNWKRWWELFF